MKDEQFTDSQEKALCDCAEILARITHKQGFIIPFHDLYGDGTRFPKLSRAGVSAVYESCIELWMKTDVVL